MKFGEQRNKRDEKTSGHWGSHHSLEEMMQLHYLELPNLYALLFPHYQGLQQYPM